MSSRASRTASPSFPASTLEHERLFRDVYDHLIRLVDALDSYRDLLTSLMDVYLSRGLEPPRTAS